MSNTAAKSERPVFNAEGALNFINVVDRHLRVVSRLQLATEPHHSIRLDLSLFYDNHPAGSLSFDLNGFSPAESVALARDIKSNPYLLREIDEYLCGDLIE
ncbi:hypothetical protein ACQUQP_04280 [Marinobacterium sp. YM272]|uniref:hypothetical protein n=1 Tax=Marinobacterium sp. YM272 TaxID=3421654 RepID=UPI003D7F86BD